MDTLEWRRPRNGYAKCAIGKVGLKMYDSSWLDVNCVISIGMGLEENKARCSLPLLVHRCRRFTSTSQVHMSHCHMATSTFSQSCAFTKYLIAVPIREKTTKTVARALVKHVYLVNGAPEILVHDQGGEFWSQVMQELADLLEIQVSKISSHRPQSNGMVE